MHKFPNGNVKAVRYEAVRRKLSHNLTVPRIYGIKWVVVAPGDISKLQRSLGMIIGIMLNEIK